MSNTANGFVPGLIHNATRVFVFSDDQRYSVRPEWALCRDGVNRYQYRAFFNGRTIGEITPSFRRDVIMADLQELIAAGGIGSMRDIPVAGGAAE